jgi:hypothetical protein
MINYYQKGGVVKTHDAPQPLWLTASPRASARGDAALGYLCYLCYFLYLSVQNEGRQKEHNTPRHNGLQASSL